MKLWSSASLCLALSVATHFELAAQSLGPVVSEAGLARGYAEVQGERLWATWTDADVFGLRAFFEPLVADSSILASPQENADFPAAINAFLLTGEPESLEAFLRNWPQSRWAAALEHNLGLLKYRAGYFTASIEYWQSSWNRAKDAADSRLRALADRSVAELAQMHARLGRIEVLQPLLKSLREREVGGAARQMLDASTEALQEMEADPGKSFKCGPFALADVRKALGMPEALAQAIRDIRSPYRGFSLTEVAELAGALGMSVQMAKSTESTEIPVPCIVNLKLGHYAAIVGKESGKYRLKDLTFGFDNVVSGDAIRTEASGYYLLPLNELPPGFELVSADEGSRVFGRGDPHLVQPNQVTTDDIQIRKKKCPKGMADYTVHAMMVSLHVEDTPVGYDPPFGPSDHVTVSYNERETLQPANLNYTNFGRQWTHNWNGCIKIETTTAATVVLRSGGSEEHPIGNPNFIHPKSQAKLLKVSATRWERLMPDGAKEVYQALVNPDPQGLGTFWLSQVVDPAGNAVTLQYDASYRLATITDASGQVTTFSYAVSGDIYKVSLIQDPFGRQASFGYNGTGQLVTITDAIGLQSQFGYSAGDVLNSLTTPYGTTSFARGQTSDNQRWIEATDPLGGKERFESRVSAEGITDYPPSLVPASSVTVGSTQVPFAAANSYLNARNTFYWDRKRMLEAPGDYTKAQLFHFLHSNNQLYTSPILESVKEPLENRVWYNYPGQTDPSFEGTSDAPNKVARVIEDGSTQLWQYDRNALSRVTRAVDPLGRETLFDYAANHTDLVQVRQKNGSGYDTIASFTWNSQHRPLTATDAAGKTTTNTWNSRGQLLSSTNPLGETTTYTYNNKGYLTTIDPPLAGSADQIKFTYDSVGRVLTRTQWGYKLTYAYDNLDRLTRTTFPDGTYEEVTYDRLDKGTVRDRLGRLTHYTYDANRHLLSETDPLNRTTLYEWCTCGQLVKLTDPKGNMTQWKHDLQSRVTEKQFADNSKILSTYGSARGLLSSVTDAKGQTKSFGYDKDDRLLGVSYTNAQVATPSVTWQWESAYPRITTMQDGIGQTQYSYVAAGQAGAGNLASVDGPFPSDTITFSYDDLGRANARSINGTANTMTSTFDALGRLASMTTGLGQFAYSYHSSKGLLETVNHPNGEVASYTYYGAAQDQRLNTLARKLGTTEIFFEKYTYLDNGNLLTRLKRSLGTPGQTLTYSYDAADQLVSVINPSDTANYPQSYAYDTADNLTNAGSGTPVTNRAFTYNNLNERITDAGVAQQFDLNGNLSGGMGFTLTWDAEDRVKSITYNGTQNRVEYDYDGQGRRARIRLVQSEVTTSEYLYVWDGLRISEKRDSTVPGFPVAIYYPQGERKFLSGTYLNFFYLRDRLGSVRGATSDTGSIIQNSDYLPYGPPAPQQPVSTDPDFGFTGHLKCPFTGLILAPYRVLGYANWLSRDPLPNAELFQAPNLYTYVANNPVNLWDPLGFQSFIIGPPGTSSSPAPTSINDPRITGPGVQNIQNGLQNQANQMVATFGSIAGAAALAAGVAIAPELAAMALTYPAETAALLTFLNNRVQNYGSQPPLIGPIIDLLNGGPGDSWLGPGPFNFNYLDSDGDGIPDYEDECP